MLCVLSCLQISLLVSAQIASEEHAARLGTPDNSLTQCARVQRWKESASIERAGTSATTATLSHDSLSLLCSDAFSCV